MTRWNKRWQSKDMWRKLQESIDRQAFTKQPKQHKNYQIKPQQQVTNDNIKQQGEQKK